MQAIAPSRALLRILRRTESSVCSRCRSFATAPVLQSGHNKWSTIKHDKAKNDAKLHKQRAAFSHAITNASKIYGPDPALNPRLATEIERAKKGGIPKNIIEGAIARGQGKSSTGVALETVILEAMVPPNVACVADFQTDNKLRTLQYIRLVVKDQGGNVTPTGYLFEKKGKIVFAPKEGVGADEALEAALEAGALDVIEDEEGRVVVSTSPSDTKETAEALSKELGLDIQSTEIIHDPNEDTMVHVDSEKDLEALKVFVDKIQEESGLQGIYLNARPGPSIESRWKELTERIGG